MSAPAADARSARKPTREGGFRWKWSAHRLPQPYRCHLEMACRGLLVRRAGRFSSGAVHSGARRITRALQKSRLSAWRFLLAKVVPSVYAYLASRDGVDSPPQPRLTTPTV